MRFDPSENPKSWKVSKRGEFQHGGVVLVIREKVQAIGQEDGNGTFLVVGGKRFYVDETLDNVTEWLTYRRSSYAFGCLV